MCLRLRGRLPLGASRSRQNRGLAGGNSAKAVSRWVSSICGVTTNQRGPQRPHSTGRLSKPQLGCVVLYWETEISGTRRDAKASASSASAARRCCAR